MFEKLVTTKEYGKMIGIGQFGVLKYIREGRLKCVKILRTGKHRQYILHADEKIKDRKKVGRPKKMVEIKKSKLDEI